VISISKNTTIKWSRTAARRWNMSGSWWAY